MSFTLIVNVCNVARKSYGLKFKSTFIKRNINVTFQKFLPSASFNGVQQLDKRNFSKTKICYFKVTSPKQALPPIFLLIFRFVAKAGAVISGQLIRKWWFKLTPEQREKVLHNIRIRKTHIAFVGTLFLSGVFLYYTEHIVEEPITKRKRFMILNQTQINQIAEFEYQHQLNMFRSAIVPSYHPIYKRVSRVTNNLLLSNFNIKEIQDKDWSIIVIDRPDITNAFALPHGKIFVFSGMLNVCTNDDQLSIVLAHEMSHSILSHVAESMSKIFLVEFILLIPSLIFWTIFPNAWALFSEIITSKLTKIFIHLPFNRSLEKEADVLGLQLAAKACYDVREAPVFWGKMKIISKDLPVEWLSTHPRHETRQAELQELVPEALHLREASKCPPLGFKYTMGF